MELSWSRGGQRSCNSDGPDAGTAQRESPRKGAHAPCPPPVQRGQEAHHGHKPREEKCCCAFPEMLTAAAVVSYSLTNGRSQEEVETLLNFLGLLECQIKFILSQRLIEDRFHKLHLDIDL